METKLFSTAFMPVCGQLNPYPFGKGKAIPLQAWTCPEESRKLRLPDFKTIGTWR